MTDDAQDAPTPKKRRHILVASGHKKPLPDRVTEIEGHVHTLMTNLPQMVAVAANEGVAQLGNMLSDHLAKEHGRVFEVQEAAFMAIAEALDERLRLVEAYVMTHCTTAEYGVIETARPLYSMRDTVEAIGDYMGAVAESEGRMPAWKDLTPEQRADVVRAYVTEVKPQMEAEARAAAEAQATAAAKAAEENDGQAKIEIVKP